jgi:hypothetical protein
MTDHPVSRLVITREMLLEHEADPNCPDLAVFSAEWPDGCEVTEANAVRAAELRLDVDWLASSGLLRDEAWIKYDRVRSVAARKYVRDVLIDNKALAEYRRTIALTFVRLYTRQETGVSNGK